MRLATRTVRVLVSLLPRSRFAHVNTMFAVADLHEFTVTKDDSALIMIYTPTPADLTSVDGPADGFVQENIVQEIDIETNVRTLLSLEVDV